VRVPMTVMIMIVVVMVVVIVVVMVVTGVRHGRYVSPLSAPINAAFVPPKLRPAVWRPKGARTSP
jgi:hypothetical protein